MMATFLPVLSSAAGTGTFGAEFRRDALQHADRHRSLVLAAAAFRLAGMKAGVAADQGKGMRSRIVASASLKRPLAICRT